MMRLYPSRERILVAAALIGAMPLLFAQGCLSSTTSTLSVAVSGPATSQTVGAGTAVSVVYTAQGGTALDIRAFYDVDGVASSGDETLIATGLPAGTNMTATWNTTGVAARTYHVGVYASDGITAQTVYAPGLVTVTGQSGLGVAFDSPTTDITMNPGGQVTLRFHTTLTGDFSYTVFYDTDSQPTTGDESTIVAGSGSGNAIISVTWNTTGVVPNTYFVGATVREIGGAGRAATAYAAGKINVVGGAFIYVMEPSTFLDVATGTPVEVIFSAGAPSGISGFVDVFYDMDQTFDGNESAIETGLSLDRTTASWDTTSVAPGTYYIGAVFRFTTMGAPIAAYAPGRVTVGGGGPGGGGGTGSNAINITTPLGDTTIFQGDTFTIRWVTSAPPPGATVSLLYDTNVKVPGKPDGTPTQIVAGLDPTLKQYVWNTAGINGQFFLIARLLDSSGVKIAESVSRGRLSIRPPYFWVGSVGTTSLPGSTLQGFNFQDHAGSSFAKVGDLDGDGIDDFLVIAQYAKPGLINPSGVGEGEAYLIFGNRTRLVGTYDLNRTGTKPAGRGGTASATDGLDQGILFTGVTVRPGSATTTGITSACSTPDMDGDGVDELAFGIPKLDSLSLRDQQIRVSFEGLLENDGHFLRGGVVLVGSTNNMIHSQNQSIPTRSATNRDGNRVIRLQEVGQASQMQWYTGTCNSDVICSSEPWVGQSFFDANKDGKCDTYNGFWVKGFWLSTYPAPYTVNPQLAPLYSWCPISFPAFVTGMYTDAPDIEPFGCRILGQALEDGTPPDARYGYMVSAIRTSSGPQFLLASAPNQSGSTTYIPDLPIDRPGSGVVYQLATCNYWDINDTDPTDVSRPHQYIIRTAGYTGSHNAYTTGRALDLMQRPISIVGAGVNSHISTVQAIPDFNNDGLMDFIVGGPNEGANGEGAAYIVFRRQLEAEGSYLLEKLALDPGDPERLNGVLIRGEPNYHFGAAFGGAGDLNGDGKPDVVLGIPNYYDPSDAAKTVVGAALVVFGGKDLVSPIGGFHISDLVANGQGVLLVGTRAGDLAGFNAASAGDMDGDGRDDLLVAAPGASPRLADGTVGLDYNGDGKADDLTNSGHATDLTGAGIVYLVSGANNLIGTMNLAQIGTPSLRGMAFVGRAANDRLGGGDDALGLGVRSYGLAPAGDVDGDGKGDVLIGAMMSSPNNKTHAGEAYLIYGGIRP